MVNLKLKREPSKEESTRGELFIFNEPYCDTLEDEKRSKKVKGETRIPAGKYEIKLRKVLSGLTKKYRSHYDWFTWHLELQDVPDFKHVYIHIGNYDEDTDGCILVGNGFTDMQKESHIWNSTETFRELYEILRNRLEKGEQVFITIYDHKNDKKK